MKFYRLSALCSIRFRGVLPESQPVFCSKRQIREKKIKTRSYKYKKNLNDTIHQWCQ